MGRRTRMAAAIVGLAVVAGAALGTGSASGDTGIHVRWPFGSIHYGFLQNRPGTPRLGDHLTARGPLFDGATPGKRVGIAFADCWVVQDLASSDGAYDCSYLLRLGTGDLTLEGIDPHGPSTSTFAVTGGTGAYRDARGDAVLTDLSRRTDMQISLVA